MTSLPAPSAMEEIAGPVDDARFAACGDFCLGTGVENAVLSGLAAADALEQMFVRMAQQQQQQQSK